MVLKTGSTIDIRADFDAQVNEILKHDKKWHFVGHSLGGLLVRSYLDRHEVGDLGRVVNIGSPAKGTPIVDYIKDRWWFPSAGEVVLSLGQSGSDFLDSLNPPYYQLGVIAGNLEYTDNEEAIPGVDDGVVPVSSTKVNGMQDFIVLPVNHTRMRYDDETMRQVLHFLKSGGFT
ncbi:MAG: alpha/beta fold hydrolase [Oligoflexales bacterium]|nr:alpha/beta fold hydrolase [Oligoflexales bacterium]